MTGKGRALADMKKRTVVEEKLCLSLCSVKSS